MEKDLISSKQTLLTNTETPKNFGKQNIYPDLSRASEKESTITKYSKLEDYQDQNQNNKDIKKKLHLFTEQTASYSFNRPEVNSSNMNKSISSQNLNQYQSTTNQTQQQLELIPKIREECYHCNNKLMIPKKAKLFKCYYCKMVCDKNNKPQNLQQQIFICGNCSRKVSYLPVTNYVKCICNAINFVPSPQQLTQSMQIPNPKFNMSMSNVNSMNRSQSMVQSETFYQRISETNQSHYIQDQLIRSNSVTSQNFSQGNMNYLYPNLNPSFSVNQNQKAQQTNSKTLTNYENLSDLNKDYSTQNFPKSNKDLHFEERMNMKIEKSEYNQDFLPLKQVVNRDLKDESQTEIKISNLPDSLAESKFIPLNTDQNYNKKEIIQLNPFQNGYRGLNQNLAESQFIENNNQDAFRKYNNQQAVNKPIWNSNQPMFFGPNHGYVETKLNLKAEKLDDD